MHTRRVLPGIAVLLGVTLLAACDGHSAGDAGRPDGISEGLDGGAGGEVPGPLDVVDEACGVVMRYVIPLGDEGLDPYLCEGDTCWLGWHGYLDLSEDLYRQGARPGMLVQLVTWSEGEYEFSHWMVSPASEHGTGVTGYHTFRAVIGHNTVPVEAHPSNYKVKLIPYAVLPDGQRILRYIDAGEQRSYRLSGADDWRIPYNPSLCGPTRWRFEQVVAEDPDLYVVYDLIPPGLALVIDDDDRPHLLYRSSQGLAYTTRQGVTWTTPEPVVEGKECHSIQLVPGVDGELHACASCMTPGNPNAELAVFYARRSAAGWIVRPVDISGFQKNCDLVADDERRVHLVVGDRDGLLHAVREADGDSWTATLLDPNGRQPGVALDRAGRLHVVYHRYEEWYDAFYLVRQETGEWLPPEGLPIPLWGMKDLEVDADGNPHVAMSDYHVPYYAFRSADGVWTHEMVDSGSHSGSQLSMRLRETDAGQPVPLISYHGEIGTLNYAERREFDWTRETVDDIDDSLATSLEIDSSGRPWIAYYSGLAGAIILATYIGEE